MNRRTFLKAVAWAGSVLGGLIPLPKPKVKNHRLCACAITVFGIDNKLYKYSVDYGYSWHIGTWPDFMSAWEKLARNRILARMDLDSFREILRQNRIERLKGEF